MMIAGRISPTKLLYYFQIVLDVSPCRMSGVGRESGAEQKTRLQ
jgi:hypothetical protein